MTTPKPPSHPSSTPKNPVATPINQATAASPHPTASTSAPRAHPSPAVHNRISHKSPAAKTPASHANSTPSATAAAVASHYDSPSAVALLSNSGTPLPHFGGLGGSTTASIQFEATTNPRDSEEERRRRIYSIVQIIGRKPGYVTPEGLERITRRSGLECYWSPPTDITIKSKSLVLAGTNFLLEIDIGIEDDYTIKDVSLQFTTTKGGQLLKDSDQAAQTIKTHLTNKSGPGGYVDLTAFQKVLQRLVGLDKLCTDINCFEALEGLYVSLRQIWDFELKKMLLGEQIDRETAERNVLCSQSGRPVMHSTRTVGLSIEYWMDQHAILFSPQPALTSPDTNVTSKQKTHILVIEFESCSASIYPPARVSHEWVSSTVEKPAFLSATDDIFHLQLPQIDWLDPPQTPVEREPKDPLSPAPLPDVRFVMKLDPPVIVPFNTAFAIFQLVDQSLEQDFMTYDAHLFGNNPSDPMFSQSGSQQIETVRNVISFDTHGKPMLREHKNTLLLQKQDFGKVLTELPFSHPRQIVEILPTLRQWTLVGTLLTKSFTPSERSCPVVNSRRQSFDSLSSPKLTTKDTAVADADAELSALMAPLSSDDRPSHISLTASFAAQPLPRILIDITVPQSNKWVQFLLQILPNAVTKVTDLQSNEGVLGELERSTLEGKIAKVVSMSEDLGVVAEWVARCYENSNLES